METHNKNSRKYNVHNIDDQRASFAKPLKSKEHLENEKNFTFKLFNESNQTNKTKKNL